MPNIVTLPSFTSRDMRPGEVEGDHYHFISKEEFEEKGNKGAIKNIDKTLKMFDESSMDKISPTTAVNKAKKVINRY